MTKKEFKELVTKSHLSQEGIARACGTEQNNLANAMLKNKSVGTLIDRVGKWLCEYNDLTDQIRRSKKAAERIKLHKKRSLMLNRCVFN